MTVRLLRPFDGYQTNAIVTLDAATENALVNQQAATFNTSVGTQIVPNEVFSYFPEERYAQVISGQWTGSPVMFKLRLMGSGTVSLDARDRLGAETIGVQVFSAINATNQIEFPYMGDDAVFFRANFPNTLAVEVLA